MTCGCVFRVMDYESADSNMSVDILDLLGDWMHCSRCMPHVRLLLRIAYMTIPIQERTQVVIAEFNSLREELIQKHVNLINLHSIYLTLLGVSYGVIASKTYYDAIYIFPVVSLALFCRYLQDSAIISAISAYIHDEIEGRKIPQLLGQVDTDGLESILKHQRLWQAWSHYYNHRFKSAWSVYKVPLFILYFVLSVVPATFLASLNVYRSIYGGELYSAFPSNIVCLVASLALIASASIGFFIIYNLFVRFYWVDTDS